jgi:hypothetical protein
MISPVDPVRRFYDALGRRDVAGGKDLPGEDARQQHQRTAAASTGLLWFRSPTRERREM